MNIIVERVIYTTYTPSHQRAAKKYYEKNKEKLKEIQKERDNRYSEAKKVFRHLCKLTDIFI